MLHACRPDQVWVCRGQTVRRWKGGMCGVRRGGWGGGWEGGRAWKEAKCLTPAALIRWGCAASSGDKQCGSEKVCMW